MARQGGGPLFLCVGLLFFRPGLGSTDRPAPTLKQDSLQSIFSLRGGKSSAVFAAVKDGLVPAPSQTPRLPIFQTSGCELFNSSQYSQCLTQKCTCSSGSSQNSSLLGISNPASTQFACCQNDTAGLNCYPPQANGTCSPAAQLPACCPANEAGLEACVFPMVTSGGLGRNADGSTFFYPAVANCRSSYQPACCSDNTEDLTACGISNFVTSSSLSSNLNCTAGLTGSCCALPPVSGAGAPSGLSG